MKPEEYEKIRYEPGIITKIVHIEGEQRNPLSGRFILELKDALSRMERNPEAKVGVILAEGTVFCSGHNLRFVSQMQKWKPQERNALSEEDWRSQMDFMRDNFYFPIWDCKTPLVMGVNGGAYVGGVEFALMGDIIVAAEDAVFDYGILRISGAGSANLLPYFMGWKKAAEILLTGGSFTTREAWQWGLVNRLVPREEVEAEAMRFAKIISLMPRETVFLIKKSLKFGQNELGARQHIWYGCETNIMGHLAKSEREKDFYDILKTQGMKAAVQFRDKPFEELGLIRADKQKS